MNKIIERKITINKGIIISDPWYKKDVKCRYENRQRMSNYNFHILTEPDEAYKDWFNVAITILDDVTHQHIKVSDTLDSFTCPHTFKVKKTEIGMDTASILIGSNNVQIEEIHTGTDGYLGTVYQLNRPIKTGEKTKNQYCGIVFFASFDGTINSVDEIVQKIVYNFTGSSI